MTWEQIATPHIGHRAFLRDPRSLRCVECEQTLVLPRETGAPTLTPPPYRCPTVDICPPDRVPTYVQQMRRDLAARKAARQETP